MLVLVAAAGCGRIGFDSLADGDGDGSVSAASCNRPLKVVQASAQFPRLAGLSTPTRIGAAWIADDGTIASGGATIAPDDRLTDPISGTLLAGPAPYTAVSVASNGTTAIGAGAVNGTTIISMSDATTLQPVASDLTLLAAIGGAHAATAITATTGTRYALYVVDSTDNTGLAGIDGSNQLSGGVGEGFQDSYLGIAALNGRLLAVSVSTDSATCELISVAADFQSSGLLVTFGGAGCRQPIMAQAPGRTDFLLINFDIAMDTSFQRIAMDNAGVITMGPDTEIGGGNEPRIVATTSGYWVLVHFSGHIRAKHLTFAGVVDRDLDVATVADDSTHDVVIHNGEPYAVWLADGLFFEHLCVN